MTTAPKKPATPKRPEGRRTSEAERHEAALRDDELLEGMPELIPPHRLRIRQRNRVMRLLLDSGFVTDGEVNIAPDEGLERLDDVLGLAEAVDDFAESIAVDPEAYAQWSAGKDFDTFFAILARYSSAVGESTSSAS